MEDLTETKKTQGEEDLTETKKTQGEEDLTETIKSQGFVINISNACFWDCSQCCQLISDIESWWIQAYPIIEQIAAVAGAITGTAAITSWIRYKLSKNQKGKELMWVKVILSKEEWNTSVLASLLGLPEDEVKTILKGFGYIWNPKKMLYVSTDVTNKLRSIRIPL